MELGASNVAPISRELQSLRRKIICFPSKTGPTTGITEVKWMLSTLILVTSQHIFAPKKIEFACGATLVALQPHVSKYGMCMNSITIQDEMAGTL